jgi:predicted phage baseplate assembly protein
MPLPLPNLDDRRWSDLVDEGRALIPRYAPEWTDHNVSDPGTTLLELLAWMVEADLYRVNRVTDRSRRKLLDLVGVAESQPQPARATVVVSSESKLLQHLPSGTVLSARSPATNAPIPFRLESDLTVTGLQVAAVQVACADNRGSGSMHLVERTAELRDGRPIPAFGDNPIVQAEGPALLLGLGEGTSDWADQVVTIALDLAGTDSEKQRDAMTSAGIDPLQHHDCKTVWEYYDDGTWQSFGSGAVDDDTRGLSVGGFVRIRLPAAWSAAVLGVVPVPLRWLRCRLAAGRPDSVARVTAIACDAVEVRQQVAVYSTLRVAPGVRLPDGQPVVGSTGYAEIELDATARVIRFRPNIPDGVVCTVLGWGAPSGLVDGELTVSLAKLGPFDGGPGESAVVPGAPLVPETISFATCGPEGGPATTWSIVADFDAVDRNSSVFALNTTTGRLTFGNGDRGRTQMFGQYGWAGADLTAAAAGTPSPLVTWELSAEDPRNRAVFGVDVDLGLLTADLSIVTLPGSTSPGADAGDIEEAEGVAAEALWAHERLIEIATGSPSSLDQVPADVVLARAAPERASTLLDFERLARAVPGTAVARARAWAAVDTGRPCFAAPGTVSVVVVPSLPAGRPQPTPGLLRVIRSYMSARCTLGTRVLVVGPQYAEVTVAITVAARAGAIAARVASDVRSAIAAFLDPLTGGPLGLGWPFGRDVARSEVLHIAAAVPGVGYVVSLELTASAPGCPAQEGGCGNVVVAATMLVTSGQHLVTVV